MDNNKKQKKGFQNFIDWYMAPVKFVERANLLLFKLEEMEAPARWEWESRFLWHLWRVFKVLYFVLFFIPLGAIGFVIYLFSWFWPIFLGELLNLFLGIINSR